MSVARSFRIGKAFHFDATRTQASALDGHTFTAEITLAASELVGPGFVADFGELTPVKRYIDAHLDHRLLDDLIGEGAADEKIADHLRTWCEDHLPPLVAARMEQVAVHTGRSVPAAAGDVHFAASHRLGRLPEGHQCGRLHGHDYVVSPLPGTVLPPAVEVFVKARLNGQLLNDVVDFEPTSELLAEYVLGVARRDDEMTAGLRVSETASSWAECRVSPR
ncbi:6-pyruvoyl tetrahydropterin synthase family protein [Streptomyces sp. NPDC058471]|uniref:6-pyruvoyl trahydropterin synthase family protein n=1 Tax=Streptomyces sp. NPDC058471 TaxID=3346516 RepID=UPI00364C8622